MQKWCCQLWGICPESRTASWKWVPILRPQAGEGRKPWASHHFILAYGSHSINNGVKNWVSLKEQLTSGWILFQNWSHDTQLWKLATHTTWYLNISLFLGLLPCYGDMMCMTFLPSQAQARCHRIGQSKAVKVYRLITRNSYEREMFDKASLKLGLDKAVLQDINRKGSTNGVSMVVPALGPQEALITQPGPLWSLLPTAVLRLTFTKLSQVARLRWVILHSRGIIQGQVSAFYRCIKEICRCSYGVGLPSMQQCFSKQTF